MQSLSRRSTLRLLFLGTLAVLGFSVWVHWPWLRAENSRLESRNLVLIWTADAASLCWFLWFGIRYCLLPYALPSGAGYRDPGVRYLLISFLIAFGIDLAVTIHTAWNEEIGHA